MWGDGMKNKVAAGKPAPLGVSAAEAVLALPRETKRLIMATADAVAILTALWTALTLKFDRFSTFCARSPQPCSFFSVFGLCRGSPLRATEGDMTLGALVIRRGDRELC